ncbi:MAG: MerR family transcriptional regulator [Deltaproteobacteria bacterium]
MKELVEATGAPKSTILHYLNQGLLPQPQKTSPNMAYYDPSCIERIRYIRHLQRRHRLSLSEIKQMMESKGQNLDFCTFSELDTIIFGRTQNEQLLNASEFCKATGLTRKQLKNLLEAKLLLPLRKNRFDPQDITMGKMYAAVSAFGLSGEDMAAYVALCEKIVDHEMAVRKRLTHHLPYDQDAKLTIELVKSARMIRAYLIDRLFQRRVEAMTDLKEAEED